MLNARGRRVLLVEDSPSDAAHLSGLIDQVGQLVITHVTSLSDALRTLDNGAIDLVMLDLGLPDAEGFDALSGIRERHDVPLIVLTGQDEPPDGPRAIRMGAQEFLSKEGLDVKAVRRAVRYAHERHELASAVHAAQERLRRYALGVAHDLRSPLSTMRGFAELIAVEEADLGRADSPASVYAERIVATSVQLSEMLEHLLADAQALGGESEVDLASTVARITQRLHDQLESAGARIDAQHLPTVIGRSAGLDRVLTSVISNSIRHARSESLVITVRTERVPGRIHVVVEDNGVGVDATILEQGQPLEEGRLRGVGDRNGHGFRAVALIMGEHDGRAWLRNSPAGGLQVVLDLPEDRLAHATTTSLDHHP